MNSTDASGAVNDSNNRYKLTSTQRASSSAQTSVRNSQITTTNNVNTWVAYIVVVALVVIVAVTAMYFQNQQATSRSVQTLTYTAAPPTANAAATPAPPQSDAAARGEQGDNGAQAAEQQPLQETSTPTLPATQVAAATAPTDAEPVAAPIGDPPTNTQTPTVPPTASPTVSPTHTPSRAPTVTPVGAALAAATATVTATATADSLIYIVKEGVGFAPPSETNPERRKYLAIAAAELDAKAQFPALTNGDTITATVRSDDGMLITRTIILTSQGRLVDAKTISTIYDDGTRMATVLVEMAMRPAPR